MTSHGGRQDARTLALAVSMLAVLTWALQPWRHHSNPTTAALAFLLVVLVVATTSRVWTAMAVAVLADLCLNFFFMPPFGTFAIADPENWIALGVFLVVSLVSSSLSAAARDRAIARKGEELKSALLSSVGHNLRTPLTSLRIAAENLGRPDLSDADRQDQTHIIRTEVERLTRLFEHVLDMARLDAGAVTAEHAWVSPQAVLEAAREQVGPLLDGRNVIVTAETGTEVRLDLRLTASALAHVLENAAHYSPDGAPIEVTLSSTDRACMIRVRDHGTGIADVDALHLFEPFYRGSGGTGRSAGTGMGLAIARGLLAVQHGRISAQSARDGGAVFTIEVPIPDRRVVEEQSE